jgi:hypothetical protein
MRKAVIAISMAFAVTLAAVVGNRMSAEAMAVVIGVVCGVGAGIPMSLLILLVLNRRDRQLVEPTHEQLGSRHAAYPPVVVIQGSSPTSNRLAPPYYSAQAVTHEPTQRQFRIVGEQGD